MIDDFSGEDANVEIKGLKLEKLSQPKVCVAIVAETFKDFVSAWNDTQCEGVDLIEWRVDYYKDDQRLVFDLLLKEDRPVIYTIRTKEEGGQWPYEPIDYEKSYQRAIDSGVIDLIDLEYKRSIPNKKHLMATAKSKGIKVIHSYHDFTNTPTLADGKEILQELNIEGVDIVKLAVMPQSKQDVLRLLQITIEANEQLDCPIITMSMGQTGALSRLVGEWSGSVVTFGTVSIASAPGQVAIKTLIEGLETIHSLYN